jgi:hypothetical protein
LGIAAIGDQTADETSRHVAATDKGKGLLAHDFTFNFMYEY